MPESIQESFFRHNLRVFKSLMKENVWPELNRSEYIERIDEVIGKCSERGRKAFSLEAGGFNVLNHGDFFLRNMLFRKIDGKICDVQFVSSEERTFFFFQFSYCFQAIFFMLNIKYNQSLSGGLGSSDTLASCSIKTFRIKKLFKFTIHPRKS